MDTEITLLTATLNAAQQLPHLIASLQSQTDRNFRWVIADGCSTDGTERLVMETKGLNVSFLKDKDFGIYDALNKGLARIGSGYYLVVGADDSLEPQAIENYRAALHRSGNSDFIAASVRQKTGIVRPRKHFGWLYGMQGMASSHAVGLLIKRSLHEKRGYYSNRFPIAADQLFVKNAVRRGASIFRADFVAGTFGSGGLSGQDGLGVLTEVFRVQVQTERWAPLQYLLFLLKLGKYFAKSVLSGRGGV